MSISSRSRYIFLSLSSICSLIAAGILVACLFSVSFRFVQNDDSGGTKYYGLFRFCFEPNSHERNPSHIIDLSHVSPLLADHHQSEYSCHLRRRAPPNGPMIFRFYYSDYELCTLILFSLSVICSLMSMGFAICTLYSPVCSLAHSVLLLAATISSIAGFVVYSYYNELKDNQTENTNGVLYLYRYGWAYYYSAGAALLFLVSLIISIFAAALVFHHRRTKQDKRQSLYL